MSDPSPSDDSFGTDRVVGIRTRESDNVQWAVCPGGRHVAPHQWVRFAGSGEIGRVIVGTGMAVGVTGGDSLPRVSPVEAPAVDSEDSPPSPVQTPWGRIGHRLGGSMISAEGEMGSVESSRYRQRKAEMPALGGRFTTTHGIGLVISSNAFAGTLTVRLDGSSEVIEIQHRPAHPARTAYTADSNRPSDEPS